MNRNSIRSIAAMLAVVTTLGVLGALETVARFEFHRAAAAASVSTQVANRS